MSTFDELNYFLVFPVAFSIPLYWSLLLISYSGCFPIFSKLILHLRPVLALFYSVVYMASAAGEGKSRVLVIGGTGYIGRFVVAASAREGHPTAVLQGFRDAVVTLVKVSRRSLLCTISYSVLLFLSAFVELVVVLATMVKKKDKKFLVRFMTNFLVFPFAVR